jgi:hypothetical protein
MCHQHANTAQFLIRLRARCACQHDGEASDYFDEFSPTHVISTRSPADINNGNLADRQSVLGFFRPRYLGCGSGNDSLVASGVSWQGDDDARVLQISHGEEPRALHRRLEPERMRAIDN